MIVSLWIEPSTFKCWLFLQLRCCVPRAYDRDANNYNISRVEKGYLMSIQEVAPEQLAELFHHYHQALAPDFQCANEPASETWNELPAQEKSCLVAAARLALLE